jgi:tetratricopeptide (TPR) repeat protein
MRSWGIDIRLLQVLLSWPVLIAMIVAAYRKQIGKILELLINNLEKKGIKKIGPFELGEMPESQETIPVVKTAKETIIAAPIEPPPTFFSYAQLADEHDHKENWDEAVNYYEKAFWEFPFSPLISHNITALKLRIYKKKMSKDSVLLDEAIKFAKLAIRLSANIPFGTLYNLARAQALKGCKEEAIGTLEIFRNKKAPEKLYKAIKDDSDFESLRNSAQFRSIVEYFGG